MSQTFPFPVSCSTRFGRKHKIGKINEDLIQKFTVSTGDQSCAVVYLADGHGEMIPSQLPPDWKGSEAEKFMAKFQTLLVDIVQKILNDAVGSLDPKTTFTASLSNLHSLIDNSLLDCSLAKENGCTLCIVLFAFEEIHCCQVGDSSMIAIKDSLALPIWKGMICSYGMIPPHLPPRRYTCLLSQSHSPRAEFGYIGRFSSSEVEFAKTGDQRRPFPLQDCFTKLCIRTWHDQHAGQYES